MRRLTFAMICTGVAVVLLAAPASAQYQPTASQVLGSSIAQPGDSVTVTGTGCPPNSAVTTSFDNTQVGSTMANGAGEFSETITIPSSATPGTHTITSTCGSVVLSSTITIEGAGGTGTSSGTLPRTGFPVNGLLQMGLGLVAAGGAVFALSRSKARGARSAA